MRWRLVAATGLAATVVAAVIALPSIEEFLATRIKAALERGHVSVGRVEVGLLDRRLTLHDVHASILGDFEAKRWQASGLGISLSDVLHGHMPSFGFRLGDPLLADRVVLEDARFADGAMGGGWTIKSLTMTGVDLDRYDAKTSGSFQAGALLVRIGLALSVGRLEETNAELSISGLPHGVAADAMMIEHFDHGRIGKLAFLGLSVKPRNAETPSVRVGEVEAGGLDFSRLLSALSSSTWSPGQPLGRLSVEQASASNFSGDSFKRYGLTLASVSLETSHQGDAKESDVSTSRLRVTGFALAPPADGAELPRLRAMLGAMGLKALKLNLDCAGSVVKPKGKLAVDRCQLVASDLGALDFKAELTGADEVFWQALGRGDYFAASRSKLALVSARLGLADNGLLERWLHAQAAEANEAPATVRKAVVEEIRHYQPAGVLITEDLTRLLDTVARFVERGGTLAINLKPDPPFVLATGAGLSPGPDLVELLGATATLEK